MDKAFVDMSHGSRPIKAESFVFERQTLPIFHGSLVQSILLKISGIVHLYITYLNPKIQISTSKTKNFVWCAMLIFFGKFLTVHKIYQNNEKIMILS